MVQHTKNRLVNLIFSNIRIVVLVFLFLVLFGTYSFSNMQRQGFPEVLVNIALVQVPYPNASALQVENDIIKPVEDILGEYQFVTEMQGIANDNFGVLVLTLDESTDLKEGIAELNDALSSFTPPEGVEDIRVNEISAGGAAFMIGVSGGNDVWELYLLGNETADEIETIDGVLRVDITNALTPEIHITFDQDALTENGVTREQVEAVIQTSQFSAPLGSVTTEEGFTTVVSLTQNLDSIEALRQLAVAPGVEVRDVADVTVSLNNNDHYNRIGFREDDAEFLTVQRAMMLSIFLEDDADILAVDDELASYMNAFSSDESGDQAVMVYSQADSTRQQLDEIQSSVFGQSIEDLGSFGFIGYLFGGVTLVLVLLFIFMNIRVAILAALAIPLSLLCAVIYLSFFGIGLNTLVLFSMVLAIGLVVDPTIVFLESVQRYKEQGFTGKEAAGKTVNTVGWGVFLAVATNVLVFVPFGIVSGFFGEIIKYIPLTIIPAMIASMVVPVLFFVPLGSWFFRAKKQKRAVDVNIHQELQGAWRISIWLQKAVRWLLGGGWIRRGFRVAIFIIMMALPILTIGATMQSGAVEPVQFSQASDSDFMLVYGDMNDAWTFEKSVYENVVYVQDILAQYPEIASFTYFEQSGNDFTMLVTLLPYQERQEKDMRTAYEVQDALNEEFAALAIEGNVEADVSSEGPPEDRYPVSVRIFDNDLDVLQTAGEDIVAFLEARDDITGITNSLATENVNGSVSFIVDPAKVIQSNIGYAYAKIAAELREQEIGELQIDGDVFTVYTTTDEDAIQDIEAIGDISIALIPGQDLTLRDIVIAEEVNQAVSIQRVNGQRYVEVKAMISDDADVFAVQEDLDAYLSTYVDASPDLNEDSLSYEGSVDSIQQSFTELFIALIVALFMIYVLLVGFFRSFTEPFIILLAVPLGLTGVFAAVAATTGQLGFLELLGVVAMAGIVVNVTILLIDFANQLKREGYDTAEAIATAIAVRFRPIMLTQLTAFGSLAPLVVYSPFWQGLASSIIAGIAASAMLSLIVTPIAYTWAESIETAPKRLMQKLRSRR